MKYDVILWDNIGSPYSRSLVDAKAIGGSEYALVLIAEAFARKGLKVLGLSNHLEKVTIENDVKYGSATFFDCDRLSETECSVLIVSRFSSLPVNIKYDRVFVLAQDQPWLNPDGSCAYDHFSVVMNPARSQGPTPPASLVCMSEWHANLFRKNYPAWDIIVIPAAIDDAHYALVETRSAYDITRRNPNKFVYASAAVKGWDRTKAMWCRLKADHVRLLKDAELHVTSPGYDKPNITYEETRLFSIHEHAPIPPRELSAFMADAAGLFFVNTYPESFCVVAAIAEIMECRTHILVEPPGELEVFRSTLRSRLPTADRETFEKAFVNAYGQPGKFYQWDPKDFRMSTLIEVWMKTIGFEHHGTFNVYTKVPDEGLMGFKPPPETGEKISLTMSIDDGRTTMELASTPGPYQKRKPYTSPTLTKLEGEALVIGEGTERLEPVVTCGSCGGVLGSNVGCQNCAPVLRDYPMLENRGQAVGPSGVHYAHAECALTKWREAGSQQFGSASLNCTCPVRPDAFERNLAASIAAEFKAPTLGLVIIAKNERDVLPRALSSSKGIVDFYTVVLDQQNNDNSIEVIDATDGLPDGPVHRAPSAFSGHAAARNEALRLASVRHATDFLLMLDADDSLNLVDGKKPVLDPSYDGYEIMIIDGSLKYRRLAITRPGAVTYKRRAHEYPETKAGARIGFLPELVIIRGSGGDARKTPFKKFLKDIEWLEKDLREMPNDPRTVFYLAQSHWDAARACEDPVPQKTHYKRARALYVQRALQENTYGQERFIARMRAATLSELFGEKFYAKAHWLAALEEDPRRWPEPAVELVRMYNGEQKFAMALAIGFPNMMNEDGQLKRGSIHIPPDDGLFVDVEPYQWKLKMELAVSIYYLGDKQQSAFWTQQLIDAPTTPEYVKTTLRSNLEFCK